jgi:hypothetical protein
MKTIHHNPYPHRILISRRTKIRQITARFPSVVWQLTTSFLPSDHLSDNCQHFADGWRINVNFYQGSHVVLIVARFPAFVAW